MSKEDLTDKKQDGTPLIMYNFLHLRIKKTNTEIMHRRRIKEIIRRTIIKRGGFPRFMVKYIIKDMIHLNLLEKINQNNYRVLESPNEKKLKAMINFY